MKERDLGFVPFICQSLDVGELWVKDMALDEAALNHEQVARKQDKNLLANTPGAGRSHFPVLQFI